MATVVVHQARPKVGGGGGGCDRTPLMEVFFFLYIHVYIYIFLLCQRGW